MGLSSPKLCRQLEVLKEFRRYESEFYSYFYGDQLKEDLNFYLIPKTYINNALSKYDYSKNIKDLDNLILYMKSINEERENKLIINIIINDLKRSNDDIITNNINLPKIKNENIIIRRDSNIFFEVKEDYSFIPLTKDIWKILYNNYNSDLILEKKGFVNNGEIYIEIEYKRIDCFFTLFKTKDLIYHYCFVLDDLTEYENFIKYLKGNKVVNTARYLLSILNIDIMAQNTFEKFKKIIYNVDKLIDNYDITIYFFGSFRFKDSPENLELLRNNKNSLYLSYKQINEKIIDKVNEYKNTHTNF